MKYDQANKIHFVRGGAYRNSTEYLRSDAGKTHLANVRKIQRVLNKLKEQEPDSKS